MAHSLPFLALRVQGLSKANNAVAFAGALAGKKGSPQRHRVRRAERRLAAGAEKSWRRTMMWQGASLHSVREEEEGFLTSPGRALRNGETGGKSRPAAFGPV